MFRNFKMVSKVVFGRGCASQLGDILNEQRQSSKSVMIFLVDDVFKTGTIANRLPVHTDDLMVWVNVDDEPKTSYVDQLNTQVKKHMVDKPDRHPSGVIGIGGGSTMDLSKAVSLMLTNDGSSADYQGWDLIKNPAIFHAAVPTLSGTGAEVSRTTVLTGPQKKLGINSDHTVFDQIVLDPEMIANAPNPQRFYTGMDCYIHCVESLTGTYLNSFSQAYGEKALDLCREVFLDDPEDADDRLMMASYCGGMSIAYSQVGICHALSYGLAFVLGLHHGIGNCVVFDTLEDYYPDGVREFRQMMARIGIDLPRNLTAGITDAQMEKMVDVSLVLEPLWENALGKDWKTIMTREKIRELYSSM
ncbi:MAG: iron-containing alcohol dehydrogenase family protein [Desulfobacteraceae bacterium]|nr:iron-containing alcohol dehydrogenase family protein [Desulfobacteraceae bacterium]